MDYGRYPGASEMLVHLHWFASSYNELSACVELLTDSAASETHLKPHVECRGWHMPCIIVRGISLQSSKSQTPLFLLYHTSIDSDCTTRACKAIGWCFIMASLHFTAIVARSNCEFLGGTQSLQENVSAGTSPLPPLQDSHDLR